MKKRITIVMLAVTTVVSICGCQKKEPENNTIDFNTAIKHTQEAESIESGDSVKESEALEKETQSSEESIPFEETKNSNETEEQSAEFSLADLRQYKFWFLSGVGGWATVLHINPDGSFSGEFHDSEMGITGDAYPNGTLFISTFSGQFTQPKKVNEYTYAMQIAELNYANELGTEEIKDGVRYCYTDVYGLEDAKDILIYLPGAPLDELPEGFRSWVKYDLSTTTDTMLPFYALNNETQQEGFSGHNIVEEFKESMTYTEERSAELEASIANDSLTTLEYNEKTEILFIIWDNALNDLWEILQYTKDAEEMAALTTEEREWIAFKEQEVQKAGAEYEGGSIQSMIVNQKAAELTKERVYELMKQIS